MSVYKNNEHLKQNDRITFCVSQEGMLYTLAIIIEGVISQDQGRLTFLAANQYGQNYAQVDIVVEQSQTFKVLKFESQTFKGFFYI